jgi:hypothetical protein
MPRVSKTSPRAVELADRMSVWVRRIITCTSVLRTNNVSVAQAGAQLHVRSALIAIRRAEQQQQRQHSTAQHRLLKQVPRACSWQASCKRPFHPNYGPAVSCTALPSRPEQSTVLYLRMVYSTEQLSTVLRRVLAVSKR